jgi:putative heme-binding domain-containing protein
MREVFSCCVVVLFWVYVANVSIGQSSAGGVVSSPGGAIVASSRINQRSDYEAYALRHQGDAQRGKSLFESEIKAACAKCHSTDGGRKGAGPDLFAIGDKFERQNLIKSLLYPSSEIAIGYGVTVVQTDAGKTYSGVIDRVTADWVELLDQNSQRVRIATDEVAGQQASDISLMPEGLEKLLTLQEFADIVAYLETLRQPAKSSTELSAAPDEIPLAATAAEFVPYFDDDVRFDRPVWLGQVPGKKRQFVVLEHFGKSWFVEKRSEGDSKTLLLDLSGVVRAGGATGLLGMAFHPNFRENHKYYLKYQIVDDGRIVTVVEERAFGADGQSDSGRPPRRLLKITSVTQDHNGGCLEFGPDGYLYIGMGDTGPQEDPQGHGQDLTTLLGKILRIDVDHEENALPYAIPPDNPFLNRRGALPEIWAYGLREPWRFSFDEKTGDLWVGDVGQNRYEEVAIVRAGENHGWNVYEGFSPFSDRYRKTDAEFTTPVMSYPRRFGVSVTGGYVYRGRQASAIEGCYIFGDFESRRVWALRQRNRALASIVEIGRCPTRLASFALDPDGEILAVGYDAGRIYRLTLEGVDMTPIDARIIVETAERAPVTWRFTLTVPSEDWFAAEFDDAAWPVAPGGFGRHGTPASVVRTDWHTNDIWLRREFNLPEGSANGRNIALRLHHDEDAEIYINGVEASRVTRWTTGYEDVPLSKAAIESLQPGRNIIAIHCRQQSGGQYIDAGLVEYVSKK